MSESQNIITENQGFQNVKEVAQFCGKSISWVYKHQQVLGVRKLGGSLFFPEKEELYERIFGQRQGIQVRVSAKQDQVFQPTLQNKTRGSKSRSTKKGGNRKGKETANGLARYGLLSACSGTA